MQDKTSSVCIGKTIARAFAMLAVASVLALGPAQTVHAKSSAANKKGRSAGESLVFYHIRREVKAGGRSKEASMRDALLQADQTCGFKKWHGRWTLNLMWFYNQGHPTWFSSDLKFNCDTWQRSSPLENSPTWHKANN